MKISHGFAVSIFFGFLALGGNARAESIYSLTTALYTFTGKTAKVYYRAGGNPSIQEFKAVKARVETVLKKFSDNGFEPFGNFFVVIYPTKIGDKTVEEKNGDLMISLVAKETEIEGLFSQYFQLLTSGRFTYRASFAGHAPTVAQILETKGRIVKIIKNYEENDLPLLLAPNVTVFVSSAEPEIWDSRDGDRLFISSKCTDEQVERFFSKYLQTDSP
jgi:hypothetical protein